MGKNGLERAWKTVRRHGLKCRNLKCRQTVALIGSALIQFSVGTVTSLGNQITYMVSYARERGAKNPDLRYNDLTILVFFGMLISGFASIPMGLVVQKFGGWQSAALGSIIYTLSFVVGYIALEVSFSIYYLAAVFIAFGVTLATIGALTEAIKWVPRWEGMVNGINYGAFAAAPAIVNPLATLIINPDNHSPELTPYLDKTEKYFIAPQVLDNVPKAYFYAILGLSVVQVVGIAFLARYPCQPEDAEQDPNDETASIITDTTTSLSTARRRRRANEPKHELEVKHTLSLPIFWKVYFLFAFALAPVLTALTNFKIYGQSFIHDDFFLAKVGGSLGVAKGLGAFTWGIVADFLYLEGLVLGMTITITIATLLVYAASFHGKVLYVIAFVMLFLAGGGIFSLYPVVLVRYFGRNNFPLLYGIGLTTIAVAAAIMAVVTIGYGTLYKGWLIYWFVLAFVASMAVWIAMYLHVLDYRKVQGDVRTIDQGSEMTPREQGIAPVQREQAETETEQAE